MKIPRGIPQQDNVGTVRRGVASLGNQMQSVRRQDAEDQAQARGVQQLGGAITNTAAALQRQGIRLDKAAAAILEKQQAETRRADVNRGAAELALSYDQLLVASEGEQITPEQVSDLYEGLEFDDPETQAYFANTQMKMQGDVLKRNYDVQDKENQKNTYLSAASILDNAKTLESLAAFKDIDTSDLAGPTTRALNEGYKTKEIEIKTRNAMAPFADVAMSDEEDDVISVHLTEMRDSFMAAANNSDAVKEKVRVEVNKLLGVVTTRAQKEKLLGAVDKQRRDTKREIELDRAIENDMATDADVDELLDNETLTPTQGRQKKGRIAARQVERVKTEGSIARVGLSMQSGYIAADKTQAQDDVDRVFVLNGQEQWNNWADLSAEERFGVLATSQTGSIPSPIRDGLSAAMQSSNPAQVQRAYEAYTLMEGAPSMKKTLAAEVSNSERGYWDAIQNHVAIGKMTVMEARTKVDESRRLMGERKDTVDAEYNAAALKNSSAKTLKNLSGDDRLWMNPEVRGLYDSYSREIYYENGGDLKAARKTAWDSLNAVLQKSNVNGTEELMLSSPEGRYGMSPAQVQDSILRDVGDLVPKNAELKIVSDNSSLADGGWQVLYKEPEAALWKTVTQDNIPQRWKATAGDVEVLDAEAAATQARAESSQARWDAGERRPGGGDAPSWNARIEEEFQATLSPARERRFSGTR